MVAARDFGDHHVRALGCSVHAAAPSMWMHDRGATVAPADRASAGAAPTPWLAQGGKEVGAPGLTGYKKKALAEAVESLSS